MCILIVIPVSQLVLVSMTHKFFAAINEMFAPVVVVSNQIFAEARYVLAKLLHFVIKFSVESVLVCIVCQKSVGFC